MIYFVFKRYTNLCFDYVNFQQTMQERIAQFVYLVFACEIDLLIKESESQNVSR